MDVLALAFLIAALVLFIIDTARSKSLVSAGLACLTASLIVPLV